VNGFRVREAVALLEKFASQRTILGLSLHSGFDSRAVFSKAFKKLTGFTPREYVRNFKRGV
jgi:AraC-like DNA-binding protein